ncbi:enoyl-CoA hydratase-related protein [Carboxylicivirga sp. N1Y90]|uniref:enoyl-CoA hydratase-related protein n=1 Tax=Carboxylicivirga fragile TaxID=3417571 RepID=UPI003D341DD0|nr:enoyl-CoA hydratase/isomerase family protein [Marinilabiliaceae bacterium N1Y90]
MVSSECKTEQLIKLDSNYGITNVSLNNPAKRNALSKEMIIELVKALKAISSDASQKVVVLKGEGNLFCSGADLDWMRSGTNQDVKENISDAKLFFDLYTYMSNFPKPIIIWVEKFAFGGATGLLACADYVVANKDAVFGYPEVKLGLVPATIAPFILRKTGLSLTQAYMMSGETFSAKEAKRMGLIHEYCKTSDSEDRISVLSQTFAKNSGEAMMASKHLLNKIVDRMEIDGTMEQLCCQSIASARVSNEGQEGVNAFFEKRNPNWNKQ